MKLWVVNVGANTNDARRLGLRSPVFRDGSFEFVPIPEAVEVARDAPRYRSIAAWTRSGSLAHFVPPEVAEARAHLDPDFENLTYGDVQNPRGVALRHVAAGDQLWFLARLWDHDGSRFTGPSDFFFVGAFEVEANLQFASGEGPCPSSLAPRLEQNAHWHRKRGSDRSTFRVVFGNCGNSARFRTAVRVTPDIAGHLFAASYDPTTDRYFTNRRVVLNKNGKPRTWKNFCSITRTVQWFLDSCDAAHAAHVRVMTDCGKAAGVASPPIDPFVVRRSSP